MDKTAERIARTIAAEIGARSGQVAAAADLLDGGATVPFVARYRKEATGGLDDTQLRTLSDRLAYLRELEARRGAILKSIGEQGKLTDGLARAITGAETKAALEDLYLPFRPKRRTKAMIARERGLEPLLRAIDADRAAKPEALAEACLGDEVPDAKAALEGARDILVEELSENADLLGRLRKFMRAEAFVSASVVPGKEEAGAKFSDYFDHREKWATMPSHRALAIMRAANEEVVTIAIAPDPETGTARPDSIIAAAIGIRGDAPGDLWLRQVAAWAWRVKLGLSMYLDLLGELRRRAHEEAIGVFARNMKDLLLAAPAGPRATLGLDPGIRTGVKAAVVDATGKLVETATLYPFQPRNDLRGAEATVMDLIQRHGVDLIAIGNGTASRETERFVAEALRQLPVGAACPTKVIVSEAGASVYSASELVKIEPKSIGVGQYQHDVDQHRLAKALDAVVEDAVNAVGVDLNMASAPLLSRVAGLGPSLARNIVTYRDTNGAFPSRKALMKVSGLGPKAFEQCAGFLRIRDGAEPLDASAVHPEAYGLARRIVQACGRNIRAIMGDAAVLKGLRPEDFVDDSFGLPTVRDILGELEKPGRDPRPEFRTASFAEGVESIADLRPGMSLEGTVTNVAAFGAFVDIGVHQDGLVHISQLADRYVKDPHEVVKAGDVVRVRVTEVDIPRKRIGLSMRKQAAGDAGGKPARRQDGAAKKTAGAKDARPARSAKRGDDGGGALGAALREAMKKP